MTDINSDLLRIQLLGGFQIFAGERVIPPEQFRLRKARTLIKVLALAPHHRLHRDQLIEMLWPDAEDVDTAINSLNQAVYAARRALASAGLPAQEILQFNEEVLSLCPQFPLWIDAVAFEQAAAAARRNHNLALAACRKALSLYPGDLLPEDRYEDWAEERRESLHQEYLRLLLQLARLEEDQLDFSASTTYLQQALASDPICEEAHTSLMRVLALNGQRSAALAQFETCREALRKELGVEPSAATLTLYQEIREGKLAVQSVTHSSESRRPTNLPSWLIPFIGRTALLTTIRERLLGTDCRLLSLVGTGGSGKTRLAVEAVSIIQKHFPGGVVFVPLTGVNTPAGIVPALCQALGLPLSESGTDLRRQLFDSLREQSILLLLDNFEHLLEGNSLVTELLQACPGVKILVTSRVLLNLLGETLLPVHGMQIPPDQPIERQPAMEYSGVRLFLEGARRVQPGYEPCENDLAHILHICSMVEGIPLSILLSAAWMRFLTPAEIAGQIKENCLDFLQSPSADLPERQRSLRAVFDHSWRLLDVREQQLLADLSVFHGGFTPEAARQIFGATLGELARLSDHSFLNRMTGGRFEIHELIRQYGEEKLNERPDGGKNTHERHAEYFITLLQHMDAEITPPGIPDHEKIPDLFSTGFLGLDQISDVQNYEHMKSKIFSEIEKIEAEIGNTQAAWDWAVSTHNINLLLQGRSGLGQFYMGRFRLQEGEQAFKDACNSVSSLKDNLPTQTIILKAELLVWHGRFCIHQYRAERGWELITQALEELEAAAQAGADVRSIKAYYIYLIFHSWQIPRLKRDRTTLLQLSLALYRELGDRNGIARVLIVISIEYSNNGELEECAQLVRENMAINLEKANLDRYHHAQYNMCGLQTTQGKFDGVEPRLNESLHHFRRLGKVRGVDRGLYFLARYLFTTGQFHQVIEPLKECMDINLRTNNDYHYHRALIWLGAARAHLGQYDLAKEELAKGDSYFYNHQNANSSSILGALCLGELALVDNLPLQVQEYLVHNLKKRESSNLMPMCFLVSALQAGAAALSGDLEQSRKSLACGLNGAPHYYDYLVYSKMLQFLILYFLRHKDLELAVEFDALARCIPLLANSTIYQDLVGQSLAAQMPGLPVDIISAAQQRGSLRDLQSTIQELSASPLFHYEKSIGE